jgi:hypothetical protein
MLPQCFPNDKMCSALNGGAGVKCCAPSWFGVANQRRRSRTQAANRREIMSVRASFDFCMLEAKPENPVGDRVKHGDAFDESVNKQRTEASAPHRSNLFDKAPRKPL